MFVVSMLVVLGCGGGADGSTSAATGEGSGGGATEPGTTGSGTTGTGATGPGTTGTGATGVVPRADPLPEPDPDVVLTLPPYPWWDGDGMEVDLDLLHAQATAWCASGRSDVEGFLYGYAPRDGVDRLCNPGPSDPPAEAVMGTMYLSGWFGGLWFGGLLGYGGGGSGLSEKDFLGIAGNAADLLEMARSGADGDVLAHNHAAVTAATSGFDIDALLDNLLVLAAYNQGYVEAILEASPPELEAPEHFGCDAFLDCWWADDGVLAYDAFRPVLESLAAPPDAAWEEMAAAAADAETWVGIGSLLWSDPGFDADTYAALLEIDAGYLLVNAAAALASMRGAADADVEAGRCALLLEAAADTWNQGYFAGMGGAAKGAPSLTCP